MAQLKLLLHRNFIMVHIKFTLFILTIIFFANKPHAEVEDINYSLANFDSNDICSIHDPNPAIISDSSGFYQRRGKIIFGTRDGNFLNAYTYRAASFNPASGKILFVFHGVSRNADTYLKTFEAIAEQNNAFVIAPEFPLSLYPKSSDYTLGVHIDDSTTWQDKENYLYSEIEHLFESVRSHLNSPICGYHAFGHSAGAQFLHRLNTFIPNNRMLRGVAANSGWYTLTSGLTNPSAFNTFPYGTNNTPVTLVDLNNNFGKNLVVLLGEEDTIRDANLNKSVKADAQGINRFERGQHYFLDALMVANGNGFDFNWNLDTVPNAGHDKDEMAASAAYYLFKPGHEAACVSTSTYNVSGLIVNEIHADPVSSVEGDANNDGSRDGLDDEFIEIINSGNETVCLSGWTISDAMKIRHSFPVGTSLAPGETIVVFGGGAPTGNFGNSQVQSALHSGTLSLTNSGDIITITDSHGTVEQQISWGNCASQACQGEYITLNLGKNQSVARHPDTTGSWTLHRQIYRQGLRYSPGGTL